MGPIQSGILMWFFGSMGLVVSGTPRGPFCVGFCFLGNPETVMGPPLYITTFDSLENSAAPLWT